VADQLPVIQILRTPPDSSTPPAVTTRSSTAASWPAVVERLREYGAARERRTQSERCDFCGAGIDDQHGHLVDLPKRALLCVCRPCYLLFTHDGAGGARFRAVPTRYALVEELASGAEAWEALDVPIGLAFFFRNSATGRTTAFYPSPAGATESELPLDAWDRLTATSPLVSTLAADVEALLVRRTSRGIAALIVPIDVCYELVGVIRVSWRGLQGGDEVWSRVEEFFARAVERARGSVA